MKEKRTKPKKSRSVNVTNQKLAGLPFASARAWKEAQEAVLLRVWHRLEESKVINEMLKREEYSFWHREFKEGLVCSYGEKSDVNLVRVFSEGHGIEIKINRSLADAAPSSEQVLGALVRAMSESFAITYYRAKGILPASEAADDDTKPKALR